MAKASPFMQKTLSIIKTPLIGLLTAIVLMPSAHAVAPKDFVIACPATIETTQKLRNSTPAGWMQVADVMNKVPITPWNNTHRLREIGFSDGHPSKLAILVPDNTNDYGRGRKFVQRWTRAGTTDLYAYCEYNQTTVQLTQQIPSIYKVCEVRYNNNQSIELIGASCHK